MATRLYRAIATAFLAAGTAATLAGCTIYASEGSGEGRGDDGGRWESRGGSDRASAVRGGAVDGAGPMRVTVSEGRFPRLDGQQVVVHLRRDALGAGGSGPVAGLNVDGPNRSAFSVSGTYRGQDGDWVMIQQPDGRTTYIPMNAILAVETPAGGPAAYP